MVLPSQAGDSNSQPTPAQRPRGLAIPAGVDAPLYFFCLLGPLALGLSIGLQIMQTGFMLIGPIGKKSIVDQLSGYGWYISHPEHDLHVWFTGIALVLLLILALGIFWRSRLNRMAIADRPGFMKYSAVLQVVLAAGSLLMYLLLFTSRFLNLRTNIREPRGRFDQWAVFLPCGMALLCLLVDMVYGYKCAANTSSLGEKWQRWLNRIFLCCMPVLIVLVIYIPSESWPYLAGGSFLGDWCNHITSYMMGPAVAFVHGRALGTDIYSQYGIGWPLLLATVSRFSGLTYSNQFGLEIVCGCLYYLGLFFLLRACFRSAVWASISIILAMYWQIFTGTNPRVEEVMWYQPQTIMIRHWWDVWFFAMLLFHRRSDRIVWLGLAGMFCGIAIFFQTETGIYLAAAFVFYRSLDLVFIPIEEYPSGGRKFGISLLAFFTSGFAILLPLLYCASRGTLFSRLFWQGWLEPLLKFTEFDLAALPVAEMADDAVVLFLIMAAVYLGTIGYMLIKGIHRKTNGNEILVATVAAYGLEQLLIFIQRSCYAQLPHRAVPFAVIITVVLFQCRHALRDWVRYSSLPYVLAIGLVVLLLTNPMFLWYPSLLKSFTGDKPHGGLSLLSNPTDISGLPLESEGSVRDLQTVIATIKTLDADGHDLVILDTNDAFLYSCAHIQPWSRYLLLLDTTFTKQRVQDLLTQLQQRTPKYVVILGRNAARKQDHEYEWVALYQLVSNRYVLERSVGGYEFWRYSGAATLPNGPLPFTIQ